MVGGATMRTASKVDDFGGIVLSGGLRGAAAPAAAPAEQAVRESSIPVSATLSSSSSTRVGADVAAVQIPAWEIEGREFAGVVEAGEPMPRVVFTGVPSFNEVNEATAELKDGLDKDYISSPESSKSRELTASNELPGLSVAVGTNGTLSIQNHALKPLQLLNTITKAQKLATSIASDPNVRNAFMDVVQESMKLNASNELSGLSVAVGTNGTLSPPNHALKAFRLLSTSTEAQNVVASVASDPNVWKAVMHNPVLQEFIESNKTRVEFQEPDKTEDLSAKTWTHGFGNWCMGIYKKVELTTVDLVTYLASKVNTHPLFRNASGVNGDEKVDFIDETVGLTFFFRLAILVVMIVLLKRI